MKKYMRQISQVLGLDMGEYKKNKTQEDWIRKLNKNNQRVRTQIQEFQEPPEDLKIP